MKDVKTSSKKLVADSKMKQPAAKDRAKVSAKQVKVQKTNPSADLINKTITSQNGPKEVNFRKGKKNVVTCSKVTVKEANLTGRRLTVDFLDEKGKVLMTRRIYKEHLEKIADIFGDPEAEKLFAKAAAGKCTEPESEIPTVDQETIDRYASSLRGQMKHQ